MEREWRAEWRENGERMVREWRENGERMVREWRENGARVTEIKLNYIHSETAGYM